ncbi:MAG: GIY-YIG nuclease family protein [Rhizomicrobium sp.]|jgi:hypothetical protein
MDNKRKREIARLYKEREKVHGVFAVRCAATGEAWIGTTPDIGTGKNREWAGLRLDRHSNAQMQAVWNAHGEESFTYEIVEEVRADNPLLVPALVKERSKHWMAELKARPIAG